MKPISSHDPLDDLIAAALHGELTPEESAQFEARLNNDPAARAAYQEAQAMHDLLEKTHQSAQPDPAFEQRMVSGVRRKLQTKQPRETAWESVIFFWKWVRGQLFGKWHLGHYTAVSSLLVVVLGFSFALYHDLKLARMMNAGWASPTAPPTIADFYLPPNLVIPGLGDREEADKEDLSKDVRDQGIHYVESAQKGLTLSGYVDKNYTQQFSGSAGNLKVGSGTETLNGANTYAGATTFSGGTLIANGSAISTYTKSDGDYIEHATTTTPQGGTVRGSGFAAPINAPTDMTVAATTPPAATPPAAPVFDPGSTYLDKSRNDLASLDEQQQAKILHAPNQMQLELKAPATADKLVAAEQEKKGETPNATPTPAETTAIDTRKLIRNAQLDLEVKSFQTAMDQITALTKGAGGYVDTSNSQKGGNGKLQGTVVVKVLPQNLDAFLLKLRDLGEVQNQSVSTDDVTKEYFDTQARLDNSRRMEAQLQDLLKHENSKVSDLLAVERELGRVRGEIEQMQGQLKLYDFQVQYATVTMQPAREGPQPGRGLSAQGAGRFLALRHRCRGHVPESAAGGGRFQGAGPRRQPESTIRAATWRRNSP